MLESQRDISGVRDFSAASNVRLLVVVNVVHQNIDILRVAPHRSITRLIFGQFSKRELLVRLLFRIRVWGNRLEGLGQENRVHLNEVSTFVL